MTKPLSANPKKTYRTVLEHAGVALAVIGEDMTMAFVNRAFLALFERAREVVEGRRWTEFAPGQCMEAFDRLRKAGPGASPMECDFPWVSLSGRKRHILATISAIPGERRYVVSFLDVTRHMHVEDALWESEEKFRTIFEGSAIAMSLVDPLEGKILVSNRAMQDMLGYTAKELAGMQLENFTHPDDIESQWTLHKDMVEGRFRHFELKKRYIRKDGAVIQARLIASLAFRTNGNPAMVVNMVEEVGET